MVTCPELWPRNPPRTICPGVAISQMPSTGRTRAWPCHRLHFVHTCELLTRRLVPIRELLFIHLLYCMWALVLLDN
ncbi:hypothetical protein P692DRAFT_201019926 [Suillus brevipes Sb2]|nr:hypothetical protein P692DRAFT_201019926 [Suillus brevipes Sb2]